MILKKSELRDKKNKEGLIRYSESRAKLSLARAAKKKKRKPSVVQGLRGPCLLLPDDRAAGTFRYLRRAIDFHRASKLSAAFSATMPEDRFSFAIRKWHLSGLFFSVTATVRLVPMLIASSDGIQEETNSSPMPCRTRAVSYVDVARGSLPTCRHPCCILDKTDRLVFLPP